MEKKEGVLLWPRVHLFPKGELFNFSGQLKGESAVQTGGKCRANREKVPRKKGVRRRVSGFGRPCASMCTAVLIIAGERAYYCDRPPVTEF